MLIENKENLGFGRANNLGFKSSIGEYVFLLNSDAYLIDNSSIPKMIQYLEQHQNVGIVGPNFIKENGSKAYAYGNLLKIRKVLSDIGLFTISNKNIDNYATYKVSDSLMPKEVGYLAAAGIIIKRSVIEKLGLFDPKFFLYFEDMELGWRYKKYGYKSIILPKATIVHLGGESTTEKSEYLQKLIVESKSYYLKKTLNVFQYHFLKIVDLSYISIKYFNRKLKLFLKN